MDIVSIIRRKREKKELTDEEIRYFVSKLVREEISDAQVSALLSYIYINGLTIEEMVSLSNAIAFSGDVIELSKISDKIVDKHSTGGVGDKASLLLMPILASLDIPVAEILNRGYGITGGIIDKLESIPGFDTNLSNEDFIKNIREIGIAIMSHNLNLAPAESKIYKLRNQIGCENSLPILASSLMSLKLATGSNKIVFDIIYGSGTYIENKEFARKLAKLLIKLGKELNKETICLISSLSEPLGTSIGDILEIKETIMSLRGVISEDLEKMVEQLGSIMISLSTGNNDLEQNAKMVKDSIKSGKALEKFKEMIAKQGGDIKYVDDLELLPRSRYIMPVLSTESGTVESIDTDIVGSIAIYLGAGRMKSLEAVNETAGITLNKKVGDMVLVGEPLAYVHTDDDNKINGATQQLKEAFKITDKKFNANSSYIEIVK